MVFSHWLSRFSARAAPVSELGIDRFLVFRETLDDDIIRGAWYVSIARGLIMSALAYLAAPIAAMMTKRSEVEPLIHMLSIVPLLNGFTNPMRAVSERDANLRKVTHLDGVVNVLTSVFVVAAAFFFRNATALCAGIVVGAVLSVVASYVYFPIPSFGRVSRESILQILRVRRSFCGDGHRHVSYARRRQSFLSGRSFPWRLSGCTPCRFA